MLTSFDMIGHEAESARFMEARQSGHLHHAWIAHGPSGIGKSLFVRRLCAIMMGAEMLDGAEPDQAAGMVLADSHPDLKWVKRTTNEKGKLRQDISVDQIRDLNHFFSLKPALAGWRIGVIDSLDEMNTSGMNALLKTLEEPPANAMLFLISHGSKPLLPTIRSRCQILRLSRLTDEQTAEILSRHEADAAASVEIAGGRPGFALEIAAENTAPVILATEALLKGGGASNPQKVAEALSTAITSPVAVDVFARLLMNWCEKRSMNEPDYATAWLSLQHIKAEADEINLTPLQTATKLWSVLNQLEKQLAQV